MRKLATIALLGIIALGGIGCTKVPVGHVGVKVYLLGGDKGVDSEELGTGRYWIGVNEDLFLFPTYTQNYVWTADVNEGSENDESITFQTFEGMQVGADVGISYHIDPDKVTAIFEKYRKGIDEITDIYLRNMVRDAFVSVASQLRIESVYGPGKTKMLADVEDRVRIQTENLGIIIERIYFIGSLRLPPAVVEALDAKIAAIQKALLRQNEVVEAEAEANKVRAKADGDADAVRAKASAEAERIDVLGEALRRNPEIIKLNAIEKWDGRLPRVITGDGGDMMLLIDGTSPPVNQ